MEVLGANRPKPTRMSHRPQMRPLRGWEPALTRWSLLPKLVVMSTLTEIETAVSQLTKEDRKSFRRWFLEFEAQQWDEQIEEDVHAGRLDQLAEQALEHLRAGRCTPL